MEKFARHALIDGVTDVRGLTVGRESELFRALSMHYNKASDFQVTDNAHYISICSEWTKLVRSYWHHTDSSVMFAFFFAFTEVILWSHFDHVQSNMWFTFVNVCVLLYFIFLYINIKAYSNIPIYPLHCISFVIV